MMRAPDHDQGCTGAAGIERGSQAAGEGGATAPEACGPPTGGPATAAYARRRLAEIQVELGPPEQRRYPNRQDIHRRVIAGFLLRAFVDLPREGR